MVSEAISKHLSFSKLLHVQYAHTIGNLTTSNLPWSSTTFLFYFDNVIPLWGLLWLEVHCVVVSLWGRLESSCSLGATWGQFLLGVDSHCCKTSWCSAYCYHPEILHTCMHGWGCVGIMSGTIFKMSLPQSSYILTHWTFTHVWGWLIMSQPYYCQDWLSALTTNVSGVNGGSSNQIRISDHPLISGGIPAHGTTAVVSQPQWVVGAVLPIWPGYLQSWERERERVSHYTTQLLLLSALTKLISIVYRLLYLCKTRRRHGMVALPPVVSI